MIGKMLKELREHKGLSQRALAVKAKTTGAYVAMLETGAKANPSKAVLRRLAKALEVQMDVLEHAGDTLVMVDKFKCAKCEIETVVYGYDNAEQRVSDERRKGILEEAQKFHDQGCPGRPTSRPHPVTQRRPK